MLLTKLFSTWFLLGTVIVMYEEEDHLACSPAGSKVPDEKDAMVFANKAANLTAAYIEARFKAPDIHALADLLKFVLSANFFPFSPRY